jgi:hypothetical protein
VPESLRARLRGLAARAPYFHNERFSVQLTEQQKSDLIAFLNSL